jgi:hypothetical protein
MNSSTQEHRVSGVEATLNVMMTTEYSIYVLSNSAGHFISTDKETLYAPRQGQTTVLPAKVLIQHITLTSSGLSDSLESAVGEKALNQRKTNIKEDKRVCWEVEM